MRQITVIVSAAAIGAVTVAALMAEHFWTLRENDYCFQQKRFVTDGEAIEAALQSVIVENTTTVRTQSGQQVRLSTARLKQYTSIDHLLTGNPGCCSVTDVPSRAYAITTFNDRLFGTATRIVTIEYKQRVIEEESVREIPARKQILISSCGNVYNPF